MRKKYEFQDLNIGGRIVRYYVVTCKQCGQKFLNRHTTTMYCCRACRDEAAQVEIKCAVCGKLFIAKNPKQIYCSQYCNGVMYRQTHPDHRAKYAIKANEDKAAKREMIKQYVESLKEQPPKEKIEFVHTSASAGQWRKVRTI